jgi:hypothetical protein
MGWEALKQWGDDVARIEPLAGGVANDVWSVRVNGHLAVGRLGAPRRPPAGSRGPVGVPRSVSGQETAQAPATA